MKKLIKAFLFISLIAVTAVAFTACGDSEVKGNTYKFSDAEISFADGVTDEIKTEVNEYIAEMKEASKGATIVFKEDGTVETKQGENTSTFQYTQDGETVTITKDGETVMTLKADGSRIIQEQTEEGVGTIKMIYKK